MKHQDQNKTVLAIGQEVAYNRSGYIIVGEVIGLGSTIKILPHDEYLDKYDLFEWNPITRDYDRPRKHPISRVKNGYSTLVLRQPNGELVV